MTTIDELRAKYRADLDRYSREVFSPAMDEYTFRVLLGQTPDIQELIQCHAERANKSVEKPLP